MPSFPEKLESFSMRSLFMITLVLTLTGNLHSQTESSALSFDQAIYDFGQIMEKDGAVSHTFVFTNRTQHPVVISKIITGCGCISQKFTRKPVNTGEKGEIVITYNPLYRPGFFSKEIVVLSKDGQEQSRIWIKGNVIPFEHPVEEDYPYSFGKGLHLNLKVLAFGRMTIGKSKEIVLRYANNTTKPMNLRFVIENDDGNLTITDPGDLKPKERGKLTVKYTLNKMTPKETVIHLYPIINGEKLSEPLLVKVTRSQ